MFIDETILDRLRDNDPELVNLNLTEMNLTVQSIRQLLEILAENTNLTSLNVSGNKIGDDGAIAFAANTNLKSLNLGYNEIGSAGAIALARNTTLTSLDLHANRISPEGAYALASNTTLKTLNLSHNETIGDDGAKALAMNNTLISLNLGYNGIGPAGAIALMGNITLRSLNLAVNRIGDAGATALARNITLRVLNLGCSETGTDGAKALADNITLRALVLNGNQIGVEAAQLFIMNSTLTSLVIDNELINDTEMYDFAQVLKLNTSLTRLNLKGTNQINTIGLDYLAEALKHNTTLIQFNYKSEATDELALRAVALIRQTISNNQQRKKRLLSQSSIVVEDNISKDVKITKIGSSAENKGKEIVSGIPSASFKNTIHAIFEDFANEYWYIKSTDLQRKSRLGSGGYGTVYQGLYRHALVAIKELYKSEFSKDVLINFQREIDMMMRLHSPYIIHFYGACMKPGKYRIVMEYMNAGSLYARLRAQSKPPLDSLQSQQIAIDIGKALHYLHSHEPSILHRDLKSSNVLLAQSESQYQVKLSDFGLSKIKDETQPDTPGRGTPQWMAPETLGLQPIYSRASDVYSYSMILWEMLTRKTPFSNVPPMWILIGAQKDKREIIPENCLPHVKKAIEACWLADPDARPSAEAVFQILASDTGFFYEASHQQNTIQEQHSDILPPSSPCSSSSWHSDFEAAELITSDLNQHSEEVMRLNIIQNELNNLDDNKDFVKNYEYERERLINTRQILLNRLREYLERIRNQTEVSHNSGEVLITAGSMENKSIPGFPREPVGQVAVDYNPLLLQAARRDAYRFTFFNGQSNSLQLEQENEQTSFFSDGDYYCQEEDEQKEIKSRNGL